MIINYTVLLLALPLMNALATNVLQDPNSTHALGASQPNCMEPEETWAKRPLMADCQSLSDKLPYWILPTGGINPLIPGTFHHGYPVDDFQLPVVKVNGTCLMLIELVAETERSNWHQITTAVNTLLSDCSETARHRGWKHFVTRTGGTVFAGDNDDIRIRVYSTNTRTLASSNSSDIAVADS